MHTCAELAKPPQPNRPAISDLRTARRQYGRAHRGGMPSRAGRSDREVVPAFLKKNCMVAFCGGNLRDGSTFLSVPTRRNAMRSTVLVLTVVLCAPTAVMALAPARPLLGDRALAAAAAANPTGPTDVAGLVGSADGSVRGNVILAKGDKTGTGPGAGGHKGQKKGGNHGKQKHEKKQ
jgi:hypothetical protein